MEKNGNENVRCVRCGAGIHKITTPPLCYSCRNAELEKRASAAQPSLRELPFTDTMENQLGRKT